VSLTVSIAPRSRSIPSSLRFGVPLGAEVMRKGRGNTWGDTLRHSVYKSERRHVGGILVAAVKRRSKLAYYA